MFRAFALGLLALCVVELSPGRAIAQDLPTAAILATATGGGVDASLGESFDRVLRSRIDALDVVEARGSVALNLADVQMALACEGETRTCLVAVAQELAVRHLVIPNLDRVGSELVLSVALFDAQGDGAPHRVDRRSAEASGLLDQVDGLLTELFGVEAGGTAPEPSTDLHPTPEPDRTPAPSPSGGPDSGRLAAAITVDLVGLAGLGIGIGFGVASQDSLSQYAAAGAIPDEAEANRRLAAFRDASDQATLANVFFVAGGVVLAAGLVWTIIELTSSNGEPAERAVLLPWAGPTGGGLALRRAIP